MEHREAVHRRSIGQGAKRAGAGTAVSTDLLRWYRAHRRDLPWRRTRDPYAIWVSEVMLQQTRVETVVPYYERFLRAFPTPAALAEADASQVLAMWSGLGYYRRARLLHQGARAVAGRPMPTSARELLTVPGIGRYTAGAIASIAHGEVAPLVDGNVARVIARLFALREDVSHGAGRERVWSLAAELLAEPDASADPGAFNQSLMELGARICVPREPRCSACPLQSYLPANSVLHERSAASLPVLIERPS